MSYVVGLTGSIATGKTTVLKLFADLGALVRSADETVHALYAGPAAEKVEAHFPGSTNNGVVDRVRLAKTLLESPERFGDLESLIHPMVREETFAFLKKARDAGRDIVVLEIPLLFETGAPYPLDATAVTWCDPKIQRRRALARPGMTVAKLETILSRQIGQEEKMKRADYRIDTSGSIRKTRAQVDEILKECRQKAKEAEAAK
jgi:dephospho-CoA kinase